VAIRVLIADDQEIVRAGLAMLLDAQPDIEVVGQAADGLHAVALARELAARRVPVRHPHAPPRRDRGHPAARRPRRRDPLAVVVITTFDLDEYVHGALKAGARGFLLKDAGPALLTRPSTPPRTVTP
jgi:DNA-binding NarL/FixJ family response regulator